MPEVSDVRTSTDNLDWLTKTACQLLQGCQVKAHDGTVLYTPDGRGNYAALWTRDFAYMVEYTGNLMPAEQVEACIRYLMKGQREDGAVPDRVRPDGVPVYVAGPESNPVGEPNLDNPMFLVFASDAYLRRVSSNHRKSLFAEWSPALDKGMDWVPRNPQGLVFNNLDKPHSPYGFADRCRVSAAPTSGRVPRQWRQGMHRVPSDLCPVSGGGV